MKKILQFLTHRLVICVLLMLVQAAVLVGMILEFQNYFGYFYVICIVLSVLVVLYIINNRNNPAYKIAWLIPILTFPVFGGLMYLIFGGNKLSRRERKKMATMTERFRKAEEDIPNAMEELAEEDMDAANQARYIKNYADSPPFRNTYTEYLPTGEAKFARMLEELKKAEHYIFLEYFIIEEGIMWDSILTVLIQKASEGLDVRVMFDDLGCIMTLPAKYDKFLREHGIKCQVFNPFVPVLSLRFNNRDHRKICVIDGHTGFTGGVNLADEYINEKEVHGHWKDVAILLKGDAVWNLTLMFLALWDDLIGKMEDFTPYRPDVYQLEPIPSDGYVQPYTDSPLDGEPVGETVYINLIYKARKYVYINTPYLIISNEMVTALCTAAKSGVDVRIVTPHIADKWYVHAVTRANYPVLVEAGVKIYEYTPGFIHAKTFVVDDCYGVVGTINLDYRSLYLHFECAVWLYRCSCLAAIKEDYLKTLEKCQPITLEECRNTKWYRKLGRSILRVFAPLM